MTKAMTTAIIVMTSVFLLFGSVSFGAENPVEKELEEALGTFAESCQVELSTICKGVTPGDGRIVACLYAFGDKLSPRCEYGLYDSIAQLNLTLTKLAIAMNECEDDLETFCSDIKPGEGRLLDCIKKKEAKVSITCITALKDVGWMD